MSEQPQFPAAPPGGLYLDAALSPQRSLSRGGYRVLIGVLVAINLVMASYFFAIGAIPIPVFLGLDVLGVMLAFGASYRSARQVQRVQVTPKEVTVSRELKRGRIVDWRSPTAFTRVDIVETQDSAQVQLMMSGKAVDLGQALSPGERVALGRRVQDAIRAARLDRSWDPEENRPQEGDAP